MTDKEPNFITNDINPEVPDEAEMNERLEVNCSYIWVYYQSTINEAVNLRRNTLMSRKQASKFLYEVTKLDKNGKQYVPINNPDEISTFTGRPWPEGASLLVNDEIVNTPDVEKAREILETLGQDVLPMIQTKQGIEAATLFIKGIVPEFNITIIPAVWSESKFSRLTHPVVSEKTKYTTSFGEHTYEGSAIYFTLKTMVEKGIIPKDKETASEVSLQALKKHFESK